jgi:hypothetical protein
LKEKLHAIERQIRKENEMLMRVKFEKENLESSLSEKKDTLFQLKQRNI